MIDIDFQPAALPDGGGLALLMMEGAELTGLAATADHACGGALGRAVAAAEFKGRKGQTCLVLAPGAGLGRVVLVGLGKPAEHTPQGMEEAGGIAAAALSRESRAALSVDGMPTEHAVRAGLGAALRSYRFDRYRTKEAADAKPRLLALTVLTDDAGAAGGGVACRARGGRGHRPGPAT